MRAEEEKRASHISWRQCQSFVSGRTRPLVDRYIVLSGSANQRCFAAQLAYTITGECSCQGGNKVGESIIVAKKLAPSCACESGRQDSPVSQCFL